MIADRGGMPATLVPATRGQRRFAAIVVAASALVFVALAPFAKTPLAPVWGFIPTYEAALVVIDNATHLAFLDVCSLGRDQGGVLQIAKAAGVPVPDSLLSLYADGCATKYLKPEDAWPLIDHIVTAQLRSGFGLDAEAVGLGPELSAAWSPIDVKVEDA